MRRSRIQRSTLLGVVPEVQFCNLVLCNDFALPFFNVISKLKVINTFQVAHVFCFSKYSVLDG